LHVPEKFNLRPVVSDRIRVNNVVYGAHEYYGSTFNTEFFGLCNCVVLSGLQGFVGPEAYEQ
jgi:hypothetical protein